MKQCNKLAAAAIATSILVTGALFTRAAAARDADSGKLHHVEVKTEVNGDDVVTTIRVTGRGGYGCNTLYPWRLTVTPGQGVEMPKTTFGKGDAKRFTREAVVFVVRYEASAGAGEIKAQLRLSVCNVKQCLMDRVYLSWPAR